MLRTGTRFLSDKKEVSMKLVFVAASIFAMVLFFGFEAAYACSVLNKEEAKLGVSRGFRGECSNSGYSVTCVLEEGSWVSCSGFGGTFSGTNIKSLIFSACQCSAQEERRRELEEQMFHDQ